MLDSLLLIGDFKDIVIVAVSLAVLGLWVLSQVMGQKPNRPQQGPPRQRLGQPPGRPGMERPAQPNLDRNLRDEIENFLKQAAAQREKGSARTAAAGGGGQDQEKERMRQKAQQKRQRQAKQQKQAARGGASNQVERLDEVEIIEEPGRRSSAGKLQPNIDTRDIQQHAAKFGAAVGQADEKLEAHLRTTFDHQVSSFGARPGGGERIGLPMRMDTQLSAAAIDMSVVRAWLQNPAEIRQAIIMREILERPESTRW